MISIASKKALCNNNHTMEKNLPEKVGEPKILIPFRYNKGAEEQLFRNPKTSKTEPYLFFTAEKVSVIVFALTEKSEVIAIDQYRHAADEIIRELPGGTPKSKDQSPEDAIREELLEETGYEAGTIELVHEGMLFEPSTIKATYNIYMAQNCKKVTEPNPEANEYITAVLTIPLHDWLTKELPRLTDSKSIAATVLALMHLRVFSSLHQHDAPLEPVQ